MNTPLRAYNMDSRLYSGTKMSTGGRMCVQHGEEDIYEAQYIQLSIHVHTAKATMCTHHVQQYVLQQNIISKSSSSFIDGLLMFMPI